MATTDISTLLASLTSSMTSTNNTFPTPSLVHKNGISLLDLKNDIFLSYLHHLSFLILCRLQGQSLSNDGPAKDAVIKLTELRVWLEKGVRPAETKLKYQIDKVLKAARDDERRSRPVVDSASDSDSDVEKEKLPTTADYDSDSVSKPRSKSTVPTSATADDLAFRPNPTLLTRPAGVITGNVEGPKNDGIYRPPKITPMSLPDLVTATAADPDARARRTEKAAKSHALDDFIASEFSTAPLPQPSIGSTITSYGRKTTTAAERAKETERTNYEENNFLRLPKMSKKEAKRLGGGGGRSNGKDWGGEDWRGVESGMGLDRIDRLTKRKGGRESVVDRSRKREWTDGGRGGDMGGMFEKRRKIMAGRRK